jgi:hypothetical protein
MRSHVWSRAAAGLAIACICSGGASPRAASSAARIDLGVAGRSNSTPSIAAADDLVAVAWGASDASGETDVFAATSRDGGRTFTPPVRVNDIVGDARVNGEQPPRVSVTEHALTIVWTAKGERGTTLLQARSTDGRTWTKAAVVPGGDAAGNRGWENIAALPAASSAAARTFAVWLDHRELAKQDGDVAASHHDHAAMSAGKPDGVAMAQKSKLYVAALDGASPPVAVTGGVCYCCKTAIAGGADGSIYTAWRHVFPGNIRDIAFTSSRDGGRTFAPPVRVSEDKWVLEGCPDDGPAMAVDGRGRIHIVWPTLVTDAGKQTIALFYATSVDAKHFSPRRPIPTEGMPHHPQIAIGPDGAPIVAWDEAANGGRRAVMARLIGDAQGVPRFAREALGDTALYPVVAAARDGAVVAWTSGTSPESVIRVERR